MPSENFSRRTLIELLPSLAALLAVEPGLQAQRQMPEVPQKVTKEMLQQALGVIGLEFTAEQQAMMLRNLNRNLATYETLRKIDVPLDTEPAFHFHPALPGKEPARRPAKFNPTRSKPPRKAPGSLEEVAFWPVTELAPLIKAKLVSSTDLTKMYLARLKKYSPKLLSVITFTEELAIEQAAQADKEIRAGHYRGPLHGIPYGAKDLFATKGIRTTWGAEPYENQVFDYDCTAVERLRNAGAILIAKLSMGALAQGGLWFGGMTKNPWNTEETSSGSSAGSAASTSAGLVGFSIGTETLGSIVSPSTRCGVTGLRPTYGRVSRFGAMGLSWTMDKIGPLCRSVEDCVLVLNAMYGPDGRDVTTLNAPLDWNPAVPLSSLKIGYLKADFDRQNNADRKKIYDEALDALRKAGAKLEPMELPKFETQPLLIILSAEAATAFDDLTRSGGVNKLRGQAPNDWPNTFRSSRLIPAVEYIRAQRARTLLQQEMDKLMSQWDVFVSPTFSPSLTITNLTGQPQMVAPCGFIGKEPQGLLFTGRLYDEGTMARVAMAYQEATEWHTMHPKVDWA